MNPDLDKLKNHIPRLIGEEQSFKAAVGICLIESGDSYDVLFQVRSSEIPDQPGDVCFPGGALEKNETFEEAAYRELCEELLITPDQLTLLGECDIMHAGKTLIHSFAFLLHDYKDSFQKTEVAEVFRVPLDFLLETKPKKYMIETRVEPEDDFPYELITGGKNYKWRKHKIEELFYLYEGHVIWGLTARILSSFCQIISES